MDSFRSPRRSTRRINIVSALHIAALYVSKLTMYENHQEGTMEHRKHRAHKTEKVKKHKKKKRRRVSDSSESDEDYSDPDFLV